MAISGLWSPWPSWRGWGASSMSIIRNLNGSYVISAMRGGYRVAKVYYGYTKREAICLFLAEYGEE